MLKYQYLAVASFVTISAVMWFYGHSNDIVGSKHSRKTKLFGGLAEHLTPATCTPVKYVSSDWERSWMNDADDIAAKLAICATMRASNDLADQWLAGVAACKDNATACRRSLSQSVFSKFVKECKPAGANGHGERGVFVEEYIEPLVGHMRHPHSLRACTPPGVPTVNIQDRSYLMLLGDDAAAIRARHPGRAILFDAGTNRYVTSLGYIIPAYARAGIHFDAIYAWEAAPANTSQYWASVPADVMPRLHYYNAPVTPQPGSAMNPVEWIQSMYRPGDYIVFKLDIDNDAVESQLVQQILDLDGAETMIAEMFFEKHYSAIDMKKYFKSPKTKYPESLQLMKNLRMKGVRVHYWP